MSLARHRSCSEDNLGGFDNLGFDKDQDLKPTRAISTENLSNTKDNMSACGQTTYHYYLRPRGSDGKVQVSGLRPAAQRPTSMSREIKIRSPTTSASSMNAIFANAKISASKAMPLKSMALPVNQNKINQDNDQDKDDNMDKFSSDLFKVVQNLALKNKMEKTTRPKRSWRRQMEINSAIMVCGFCFATSIAAPIFLHVDEEGSWTYNVTSSSVWLWWFIAFKISLWFTRNLGSDIGNAEFIVYITKLGVDMATRGICRTLWSRLLQFPKIIFSEQLSLLTRGLLAR